MEIIEYTTSYPEQELDLSCFSLDTTFFPAEEPTYTKPTRTRAELYLPTLYFPAVDPTQESWDETLGAKTFVTWLKLHTLVNHEHGWNQEGCIHLSLESTMSILGMAKSTFYRTVIHPLWNYGLIDLVESDFEKNGTRALNIIVYPYPLNDRTLATKPLSQLRNYKTDYKSKSKQHGEKGAQMRQLHSLVDYDELAANDVSLYSDSNELEEQNPVNSIELNTGTLASNSTVSFLKPKYSTTNLSNQTQNTRYLTIKEQWQFESFIKTLEHLQQYVITNYETSYCKYFVSYLFNNPHKIEFIYDVFDVLWAYCENEKTLDEYIIIVMNTLLRGEKITNPRVFIRDLYLQDKCLN